MTSYLRQEWIKTGIPLAVLEDLNSICSFEQHVEKQIELELKRNNGNEAAKLLEEYEVKFRCDDSVFEQLSRIGAIHSSVALENNIIWDKQDRRIHQVDARLRLRTYDSLNDSLTQALVTVKQPKPLDADEIGDRQFEAEVLYQGSVVVNGLQNEFEAHNYETVSSYQRIRHKISCPEGLVSFDVDLFPDIGRFIEVEGPRELVQQYIDQLELPNNQIISLPYDTIHADWCVERGIEETDKIEFSHTLEQIKNSERKWSCALI